jgi:hypothetical protein
VVAHHLIFRKQQTTLPPPEGRSTTIPCSAFPQASAPARFRVLPGAEADRRIIHKPAMAALPPLCTFRRLRQIHLPRIVALFCRGQGEPPERRDPGISAKAACERFHKALPRKRLAQSKVFAGASSSAASRRFGSCATITSKGRATRVRSRGPQAAAPAGRMADSSGSSGKKQET